MVGYVEEAYGERIKMEDPWQGMRVHCGILFVLLVCLDYLSAAMDTGQQLLFAEGLLSGAAQYA